jgi:hypothetical protein
VAADEAPPGWWASEDVEVTMHLRLVVGGLLTGHPVLATLLLNYADLLQAAPATTGAKCFIVPRWTAAGQTCQPRPSELLTVQVHAPRSSAGGQDCAEVVWRLVHSALTGDQAVRHLRARYVATSEELVDSTLGTTFTARTWHVAALTTSGTAAVPARWVPWPACDGLGTARSVTPDISAVSMN